MKHAVFLTLILATAATALSGCSYGALAVENGKAVLTKNGFMGLVRDVYVCDVSDAGLVNCKSKENP